MNEVTKSRWQVRLAALVIFILGFTAGILALNVYRGWARGETEPPDRIERLSRRLNLTPEQRTKMQQVFSDTRERLSALRKESEPKVNEIRMQADERMQQILTPEQWQQFQKMKEDMRHRRGGRGGPRGERRP